MNLDLSEPGDAELVTFVFDTTIEQWRSQVSNSIDFIATDTSITSMDDMLRLTGSMQEMICQLECIRTRLVLREQVVVNA